MHLIVCIDFVTLFSDFYTVTEKVYLQIYPISTGHEKIVLIYFINFSSGETSYTLHLVSNFKIVILQPANVVFVKAATTIVISVDIKPSDTNKHSESSFIKISDPQKGELIKDTFLVDDQVCQLQ